MSYDECVQKRIAREKILTAAENWRVAAGDSYCKANMRGEEGYFPEFFTREHELADSAYPWAIKKIIESDFIKKKPFPV
jgi:hypothetical protein